jgi:two-component system response regulator AgrA
MAIYILEDQIIQALTLRQIIEQYCQLHGKSREPIHTFKRASDLLSNVQESSELNLYFIDLEINFMKMEGLEVAKQLRYIDKQGIIVFVNARSELIAISYKYYVSALTFIEKSLEHSLFKKEINTCLKIYLEMIEKSIIDKKIFIYQTKTLLVRLYFRDIYFFSTIYDHRILLTAKDQIREFQGILKDIEKCDARLCRIHQSFIVNLQHIMSIDKSTKEVILTRGERLPISRSYYKRTLSLFGDYVS